MTSAPTFILDAGPSLTFCAAGKQRVLYGVLAAKGVLAAPEAVDLEVRRKARQGTPFEPAARNWVRLVESERIELLSDDRTPELDSAMVRVAGIGLLARARDPKDVGEDMVMAHALVLRARGLRVAVLIDEVRGQQEAARLRLPVLSTEKVLRAAARQGRIVSKQEMRDIYTQLRRFDDGLVDISQTELLGADVWSAPTPVGR